MNQRIALITPMKPPDHPTPSGDRTFARLIRSALTQAGHSVELPTDLRTWSATPDALPSIEEAAAAEVERILGTWQRSAAPDAILTYHNYHKAPDLVGCALAERCNLPYAIVEASRSPRRAVGEWSANFDRADRALTRADALAAVTRHDLVALHGFAPEKTLLLPPFIDTVPFQAMRERTPGGPAQVVCAAMLRPGRKAESVRLLAEAWAKVTAAEVPQCALTLYGDGEARAELEPLFPAGTFAGLADQQALARAFASADIFVWPAIDEPFGFVFLEAQAAGLPVIGSTARGVVDVVKDGETGLLVPERDADALAAALIRLIREPDLRTTLGDAARAWAAERDLSAGANGLAALLNQARARRSAMVAR